MTSATLLPAASREGRTQTNRVQRLPVVRFFLRYPIFLLAFGPPQFKKALVGVDTSQAHFDLWNVLQVVWLGAVALRAAIRLATRSEVKMVRQVRSIFRYGVLLGVTFLVSIAYSPGKVISLEFLVLYCLDLLCVFEFVADVYRTPPDWMQCIFQLRLVALILTGLVFVTLLVAPEMVMRVTAGVGIRLSGGTIGPVGYLCPLIAIVSAFAWLERLESRVRAGFYFGIGVAGTFLAQSRGFEICLLLILAVLVVGRARKRRSAAQMLIAASLAAVLLLSFLLTVVNGEQIWSTLNHGQSAAEIASASGRTDVWKDLIAYCLSHPQGLGYIAGMRHSTLGAAGPSLHASLHALGGTDNAYMEVLADAGWLALGLYLMWLGKIAMLGVRTLKYAGQHRGRYGRSHAAGPSLALATRCTLLLLLFCGIEGMESSEYVIPMMVPFYLQNTLIAILLGLWTSVVLAERRRVI